VYLCSRLRISAPEVSHPGRCFFVVCLSICPKRWNRKLKLSMTVYFTECSVTHIKTRCQVNSTSPSHSDFPTVKLRLEISYSEIVRQTPRYYPKQGDCRFLLYPYQKSCSLTFLSFDAIVADLLITWLDEM
jgi:hypothetical protein